MAKALKARQINFTMPNKVGLLCDVTRLLGDAKINIEAVCAYEWNDKAYFMLVVEESAKSKRLLARGLGVEIETEDIIAVEMPNRAGELQKTAAKLAEGNIDIRYLYGTPGKGRTATIYLKTENDRKALKLLA